MADDINDALYVSNETVDAVVEQVMALDGSPILHGQVRKTLRALIALGWNDWPEREVHLMADRPRRCPLHGEPVGPPPARNCPACRAAIDASVGSTLTVRD